MIIFMEKGKENTQKALSLAIEKARELGTTIVIASNSGSTAGELMDMLEGCHEEIPVVMVSAVYGMKEPGKNQLSDEKRAELKSRGVRIVTAAHALSGAERAFSNKFHGQGPIEIMAHTLRMFSQGVKVGVECATMALDAGEISYGIPVVAVAAFVYAQPFL